MAWTFLVKRIGRAAVGNTRLNSTVFTDLIYQEVKEFAEREVLPKYKQGVQNWKPEHKPDFSYHIYQMLNVYHLTIGTHGGNADIYRYVDQGTSIRWAVMSQDWVSKTDPSRYWSEAGHGRVTAWGRRYMEEHGLAARKGLDAGISLLKYTMRSITGGDLICVMQ